jgi:hypothetical protein
MTGTDQDLHQEAIELRFGQRVSAFHLDGVLGGHHQEGEFEFVGGVAAGDGALLHGFEQRGLRFGRGAIDFIGQHQVGEDRPVLEAEGFAAVFFSLYDHAAHNVGGHQVGCELNARILELKSPRQCAQKRSLAQAGNAFQKHVAAGEQTNQHTLNHVVLADDDFGDFTAHAVEAFDGKLQGSFGRHVVYVTGKARRVRTGLRPGMR